MAWEKFENIRGPQGPKGDTGVVRSISAATVPAGQPAKARMTGTTDVHLHLEIPKGDRGVQGPPGVASSASAEAVPYGQSPEVVLSQEGELVHARFKIPTGAPGVNAIPTEEAVGAYLGEASSATRPGLEVGMAEVAADPNSEFAIARQAELDALDSRKADVGFVVDRTAVSVADYGAIRDGSADTTVHVQAAVDALTAAGGTIWFPPGRYLMRNFVRLPSNVTVTGMGATLVKDDHPDTVEPVFAALGGAGWLENVTVRDLRFEGALPAVGANAVWAHRVRNLHVDSIVVDGAVAGGHAIDLMGCDGVVVERSVFRGSSAPEVRGFAEAIQLDASVATGSPVVVTTETYDGTPTCNVVVRGNRFEKFGAYNAPRPFGSHSVVENRWYTNITFEQNYCERPNVRTTGDLRALLSFRAVEDVTIRDNQFLMASASDVTHHVRFYTTVEWIASSQVNNYAAVPVSSGSTMKGLALSVSGNATDTLTIPMAEGNFTEVAFTDSTNFDSYSGSLMRLSVIDGIVNLDGVMKCSTESFITGATRKVFANIPAKLRPPRDQSWVRPGSGTETWTLDVLPDGSVSASRYSGTQAAGVWMPVAVQWRRA